MDPQQVASGLRANAFSMMLAREGDSSTEPFGFINEFRQGDTVVTLIAFKTGDVSLYFSTGGGILGGRGRPELAELARQTIEKLAPVVAQLNRTDDMEVPGPSEISFYILTPSGRYSIRAKTTDMVSRDGTIVQLARLAGALMTKVRESSNGQS